MAWDARGNSMFSNVGDIGLTLGNDGTLYLERIFERRTVLRSLGV